MINLQAESSGEILKKMPVQSDQRHLRCKKRKLFSILTNTYDAARWAPSGSRRAPPLLLDEPIAVLRILNPVAALCPCCVMDQHERGGVAMGRQGVVLLHVPNQPLNFLKHLRGHAGKGSALAGLAGALKVPLLGGSELPTTALLAGRCGYLAALRAQEQTLGRCNLRGERCEAGSKSPILPPSSLARLVDRWEKLLNDQTLSGADLDAVVDVVQLFTATGVATSRDELLERHDLCHRPAQQHFVAWWLNALLTAQGCEQQPVLTTKHVAVQQVCALAAAHAL